MADDFVAQTEPLHGTRAVVLQQDIGILDHAQQDIFARARFEVERDAALVAVHVKKAEAVGALHLEPHGPARLVAATRWLYLDHVGTQVGQQHAGIRPRHDLANVEHANAGQRQRASGFASCGA